MNKVSFSESISKKNAFGNHSLAKLFYSEIENKIAQEI